MPSEENWMTLVSSEPALLEASLSLAARYTTRTNNVTTTSRVSDIHTYRAIKIINERMNHVAGCLTDGILGAVFTLSFSEVDQAFNLHHINSS